MTIALPFRALLRHLTFISLFSLLSTPDLRAEDEQIQTLLQVISFKPVGGDNSFFLSTSPMKSPEKQAKVRVSSNTLLPPIQYKGPRTLSLMLLDETNQKNKGEKKAYRPMARVTLPRNCKRTIVLLIPGNKESKLPYRAIAMDGELKNFKAGSRRFINLSNFPVRGELGAIPFKRGSKKNLRFHCKAQQIKDIPQLDPSARVLASQPVILEYFGSQKKWNTLTSTRWFHTPTQRHLIFVYFDSQRRNLILRGISDTVAADTRDLPGNRIDPSSEEKENSDEQKKERRKRKEKGPQTDPRQPL